MASERLAAIGFDYLGVLATLSPGDFDGFPHVDHRVLDLVGRLRSRGHKIGCLSNLAGSWAQQMREEGTPNHFDAVLLSGETGHMKPHREAFAGLAAALGEDLSNLIFIDDSPSSLVGVDAFGVTPIRYIGYEQLVRVLADLGIET